MDRKKIYMIAGVLILAVAVFFASGSSELFQGRLSNKANPNKVNPSSDRIENLPNAEITRDKFFAELVKVKIEMMSSSEKAEAETALNTSSGCFDDTNGNAYESYICYGASKSWDFIYNHDGADPNFYPGEKVSRINATWYFVRMFYSNGQPIESVPSKNIYSDVSDGIFLANYVEMLSEKEIFSGDVKEGEAFKPFDNITQGSFTKWVNNLKR